MSMLPSKGWVVDAAGCGVMAAVAAAAYFAVVAPVEHERQVFAAQRGELEAERGALSELEADVRSLRASLTKVRGQLKENELTLDGVGAVNARVAAITALAEESGLVIEQIGPGAPQPARGAVRVPIRLGGTGSYSAFTGFVSGLHERFRDVEVVAFTLQGQPEQGGAVGAFGLELGWYAAPEGAAKVGRAGSTVGASDGGVSRRTIAGTGAE